MCLKTRMFFCVLYCLHPPTPPAVTATQLPLPWLQLHTRMHRLLPGWLTHKQHVVVLRQLIGAHLGYGTTTGSSYPKACMNFCNDVSYFPSQACLSISVCFARLQFLV